MEAGPDGSSESQSLRSRAPQCPVELARSVRSTAVRSLDTCNQLRFPLVGETVQCGRNRIQDR
jgi:hypothetical protein